MKDALSPEAREAFAKKVLSQFGELAIDKRRLPDSRLTDRGIPSYVAEWVLDSLVPGVGRLTAEEAARVQDWTATRVPGPAEQNSVKMRLTRGQSVKVLTPVQVEVILKRNRQDRVAKLPLLAIDDACIADETIERYPDLLRQGMWGLTELISTEDGVAIVSFKPMQATVNVPLYKAARKEFSLAEWRALMILSMGYSPEAYDEEQQVLLLCRLLPLVQKNMHLMELAPKGTGKSYVFENINPRVRLVSTPVSSAVLFVNNATGQFGLLARYKAVVLDEVQSLKFEKPEEVIGGLKAYLANGKLTRGGLHESSSDCGLVLLANILLDDKQRPIRNPVVSELPKFLQETAFLDRLRGLLPGWELPKLGSACFANSVGLKSDFFGDVLVALRDDLGPDQMCARRVRLCGEGGVRNEFAVRSIASGLVKILFPDGDVDNDDFERWCVQPAVRLRQFVWDQLYALDAEYRQYDRVLTYTLQ
jgi:ATP-dependent Lon protease